MPVASVYPRLKVPQRAEALCQCEAMRGWNIDDTPTTRGTSDTCGGVALPVKVQDERTRVQHEAARTRVTERERERACESSLRAESSFLSARLSGKLLRYRNRLWPSAHWNRHTWKVKQQAVRFLCLCVFYTHLNPSSSLSPPLSHCLCNSQSGRFKCIKRGTTT